MTDFSIVVPTYQRAGLVKSLVLSLGRLEAPPSFECIVVCDGSTDGTAAELRALAVPFPLQVLEQPNSGAAAARNRGAAVAKGKTLLFIDDDMVAEPRLLSEHARSIADGAEVVLGHLPLYPDAIDTILSRAVGRWAESRCRRLAAGGELGIHDMLTGQISIGRQLLEEFGGFDGAFTAGGTFGNEDIDLGVRLLQAGRRIVFNPLAITWQNYAVGPAQYLKQWRDAGAADVAFTRKHPGTPGPSVFVLNGGATRRARWLYQPLARTGPLARGLGSLARRIAVSRFDKARGSRFWSRFFFAARDLSYWQGVHDAGGIPRPRPVRVLCYHAIADLSDDAVLRPYGVPPARFVEHLQGLQQAGYHFVTPREFSDYLEHGTGLPRNPLLVTFDDCYADLKSAGLPILRRFGVAALAFAVSGRLGGRNEWDVAKGRKAMSLLDAAGLAEIAGQGVEIGGHSRTHPNLKKIASDIAREEIEGSRRDLEAIAGWDVRYFAYPYGAANAEVERLTRDAGYFGAFTVNSGTIDRTTDRFALPRIEVLSGDTSWGLRWKLWTARFARQPQRAR